MARSRNKRGLDNKSSKSNCKKAKDEIAVEFHQSEYCNGYDEANSLVLPSKKVPSQHKPKEKAKKKLLSKKQLKKFQKIVDQKKKKEQRSEILSNLSKLQVTTEELQQYTSISTIQTLGIRKVRKEIDNADDTKDIREYSKIKNVNSIAGVKKRKRQLLDENDSGGTEDKQHKCENKNFNEVGFSSESDDDDDGSNSLKPDENVELNQYEKDDNNAEQDSGSTKGTVADNKNISEIKEPSCETERQEKNDLKLKESSSKISKPVALEAAKNNPTTYVHVYRSAEIQAARLKLPILAEEQSIMEAINENNVIILAGETGSGKTTQLPQFLYEAGYAKEKMIGITEPRRVAAVAMSQRVAKEMNLTTKEVSYLIRFEGNVTKDTKIKFMTDGVLLKEIEKDFLLSKYSVIIIDEAHERSVYTDILIGLLSRIVPLRNKKNNKLKMIIMSATLRVEDFTKNSKLFQIPPPVLLVEARQFPVTIHFQKRTPNNYLKAAFQKVCKIHAKLPEGGILLFLTGQQEVNKMVQKLREKFPLNGAAGNNSDSDSNIEKRAINRAKTYKKKSYSSELPSKFNLDNYNLQAINEQIKADEELDFLDNEDNSNDDEIDADEEDGSDANSDNDTEYTKQPLWVLPLYSLLATEKQSRVFQPSPPGCRLCVVSTNVAETSLTIPNIKYVVDCGRQKTKLYDKLTGVSTFVVTFTNKASANQRSGRAGRVSAGHCYRLYSAGVFANEFDDFAMPDIQRRPVDDLMLQMKCMGIEKVINFPFPSPPDLTQLQVAEKHLILLGALEKSKNETITKVTQLGRTMSMFPVSPKYSKMLALSCQQNLLPYTICLVAALSVPEVCAEGDSSIKKWFPTTKNFSAFKNCQLLGDPMVLLRIVGAVEYADHQGKLQEFCKENDLRLKAITEIRKLRVQLINEINLYAPEFELVADPKMQPPSDVQAKFLRQILLCGLGSQVARKVPNDSSKDKATQKKLKYAYECSEMVDHVFLHSSSALKKAQPEWVVYQEVFEVNIGDTNKMFIRGITAIEPDWLLLYVPELCNIHSVKEEPSPKFNSKDGKMYCYVDATFGRAGWELPLSEIEMPIGERAFRYFGMFFLNGDVCPKLVDYKNKLKSTPNSLLKSWANLNSFVSNFMKAIAIKQCNSRNKLCEIWKDEPTYLLEEYADLLYNISTSELFAIWPPIEK